MMSAFHSLNILPLFLIMLIISVNTQGLRLPECRTVAFNFFKRLKYDIIFLQETHWTVELENTISQEWNGNIIFNHGTAHSCGVAILFTTRLNCQFTPPQTDNQGRIIALDITIDDQTLHLVNIYAPRTNTERQYFYRNLNNYLSSQDNNILGGDSNSIADPKYDKSGGNPKARQSANNDLTFLNARFSLLDIWRSQNKNRRCILGLGQTPLIILSSAHALTNSS